MLFAITFLATLSILAIPVTVHLVLKAVLNYLTASQVVGGLPKELRAKELDIVALQTKISEVKEETRLSIAKSREPNNINIHS